MTDPTYRVLDHPADLYLELEAHDERELFVAAAQALYDLTVGDYAAPAAERLELEVEGRDLEHLLQRWLSELLFVLDAQRIAVRQVEVTRLETGRVSGSAQGVRLADLQEPPKLEIKAATFHGLQIDRGDGKIVARVLFDV
ncbi:MAG: archease [Candidatus Alcyoniella australis]|nr:archease [Candidatus Alcyoniella australis]